MVKSTRNTQFWKEPVRKEQEILRKGRAFFTLLDEGLARLMEMRYYLDSKISKGGLLSRSIERIERVAAIQLYRRLTDIGFYQALNQGLIVSNLIPEKEGPVSVYSVELCDGVKKSDLRKFIHQKCPANCTSISEVFTSDDNHIFQVAFFKAEKEGLVRLTNTDKSKL